MAKTRNSQGAAFFSTQAGSRQAAQIAPKRVHIGLRGFVREVLRKLSSTQTKSFSVSGDCFVC